MPVQFQSLLSGWNENSEIPPPLPRGTLAADLNNLIFQKQVPMVSCCHNYQLGFKQWIWNEGVEGSTARLPWVCLPFDILFDQSWRWVEKHLPAPVGSLPLSSTCLKILSPLILPTRVIEHEIIPAFERVLEFTVFYPNPLPLLKEEFALAKKAHLPWSLGELPLSTPSALWIPVEQTHASLLKSESHYGRQWHLAPYTAASWRTWTEVRVGGGMLREKIDIIECSK